jgi:hypothetical protein
LIARSQDRKIAGDEKAMRKSIALTVALTAVLVIVIIIVIAASPGAVIGWLRENAWWVAWLLLAEYLIVAAASCQARAETALGHLFGQLHDRVRKSEDAQERQAASLREMAAEIERLTIFIEPLPPYPTADWAIAAWEKKRNLKYGITHREI